MSDTDLPSAPLNRRGFLGAAAAAGLLGTLSTPAAAKTSAATVISTESGQVTGVQGGLRGVTVYKGVPYADTTAGANRWRPPQPAPSWNGVRAADSWGPACPQPVTDIPADQVPAFGEDCLNLNIWTADSGSGDGRPVLVWLYGGDRALWAGQEIYNGSLLASKGVVVVTPDHRVGPLGGLAHPELTAESAYGGSGNWGIQDVVAALEWVRRNIGAFGGDPDRVTLGGWGQGASIVNILLASRRARGLYHRALLSSGVRYTRDPGLAQGAGRYRDLADAETDGTAFAARLGAADLAGLRALAADDLVTRAAADTAADFGHVLDGYVLPDTYTAVLKACAETDVPVLTGVCKDANGASPGLKLTLDAFQAYARSEFGPLGLADTFLSLYPADSDTTAARQFSAYARDEERVSAFLWATQFKTTAANSSDVYTYFWTRVPPGYDDTNPVIGTDATGAFEGSDVYYLLGYLYNTGRPWTSKDYDIADTTASYVARFAATGDPNGSSLADWPALATDTPQTMELGAGFGTLAVADSDAKLAFLQTYLQSQTTEF
ncbi:carboxylesterase/lipase family protein [Streptomyces fuscichromogenes]|uniref:Carboxylic ester hydrolase n=1 Tax=Streptomyces fuscichromogenes TaxID=1324013 RepID=A0A917XE26_9ACTN|nr:carboxylesterase family protein [Streptomyces fuscichromogenes]GGN11318.1 carboxylic ester hydrolase [Streptomyces fuscichromogenes]